MLLALYIIYVNTTIVLYYLNFTVIFVIYITFLSKKNIDN